MDRRHDRDPSPLVTALVASAGAAASVEAQQYTNLELVSVTGGSLQEAIGGLERARGELVVHLDAGDTLLPGAIEGLVRAITGAPGVIAAYPGFRLVDERGTALEGVIPDELDLAEMLRFQLCPVGPAAMLRRDAAREIAGLEAGSGRCGELAFWLRLAARGKVRRLTEPLACRRADAAERVRLAGGRSAAQERLAAFERIVAELDLPPGSEATVRAGARSACVLAALEFAPGAGSLEERFFIADRFSELGLEEGAGDLDAEIARLEARKVNLEQQIARQRAVIPLLEETVATRENRLADGAREASLPRRLLGRLQGSADG